MEIGNIIKGHVNELLGLNKDISEGRLLICYNCPIYSSRYGGICSDDLWLNEKTGDVSAVPLRGYRNGCGCRLKAKTSLVNAKCPLGKW